MRIVSPWIRRITALRQATDTFGPDILAPESADHELGAIAIYSMLSDVYNLTTTYVSPRPIGFDRNLKYVGVADGESRLILSVRPERPFR